MASRANRPVRGGTERTDCDPVDRGDRHGEVSIPGCADVQRDRGASSGVLRDSSVLTGFIAVAPTSMKTHWRKILTIVVVLISLCAVWRFVQQDKCLDAGGRWDGIKHTCDFPP